MISCHLLLPHLVALCCESSGDHAIGCAPFSEAAGHQPPLPARSAPVGQQRYSMGDDLQDEDPLGDGLTKSGLQDHRVAATALDPEECCEVVIALSEQVKAPRGHRVHLEKLAVECCGQSWAERPLVLSAPRGHLSVPRGHLSVPLGHL